MFLSNQIQLIHFQKARILSEKSHNKRKNFKKLQLTAEEKNKLQNYSKTNVSILSENDLVEFQELYCKQRILEGINSGKFSVNLEFTTDIHCEVINWLKKHGYYLCPDKPINYENSWLAEVINPTPESTTKFDLLW